MTERAQKLNPVVTDLWVWQAYDPRVKADLSSCLIRAERGLIVVDPIDLPETDWALLGRMGPVVAIVLTNGNHSRASARFRSRLGAPVLAHPDAVGELESPVDGTLRAGQRIGGSLEHIELPGAGPGEVALYDGRGRLHLGDALINLDSTGFAILPEKYCSDSALLKRSLQRLGERRVEVMTFAHGAAITGAATSCLADLLQALRTGLSA